MPHQLATAYVYESERDLKHTPTMRNYLVAVHEISQQNDGLPVSTGSLAELLEVTPGTVTSMMKQLSDAGLLTHKPYRGVEITPEGKRLVGKVKKRREILQQFLIETLEMADEHAHDEAANIEPLASDRLITHIEKRVS